MPRIRLRISTRLMIVLCLLVLLQSALLGGFALRHLADSLEDQMAQRALQLASMIAQTPSIREAVAANDSEATQRVASELRDATDASFISIGNAQGIRLAHPLPDRIGKPMVGGDNDEVLKQGHTIISQAVGSMGPSIRGKAPVFNDVGEVVGVVSIGYLTQEIDDTVLTYQRVVFAVTLLLLVLSVLAASWIARRFRAAIFDLEPHQIAALFEERNATLESIREGIIAINAEGKITTCNRAAIETLGLEQRDVVNHPIREVVPDSRLPDLLESGEPEFDTEMVIGGRSLIINRIPIRVKGKLTGVVASFRIRDELTMVSRQLTRIRQYAETLRSQAHEYANKLHTIAGLIQLDKSDEALELIGQETRDHQAMLRWLVDSVDDPVVSGCLLGKFNRAHELGLQLVIDPDSHLGPLPANITPERLVTLIGNLIDNALDATLSAKGRSVFLSMTDIGQDLIFEVEDQGPGISEEDMPRVFDRGFSRKAEGRGIGLHLVKEGVSQLGGEIVVENLSAGGARFTLYLPRESVG
ncbi:ATP-binding protein [Marinobacterium zhoushanense]|nr:sensor histidine kinase [Marinobacterium zhoushanense]